MLGPCGVFDTEGVRFDYVTLPDGSRHGGSDCPAGALLAAGGSVGWTSDNAYQGSVGYRDPSGCDEGRTQQSRKSRAPNPAIRVH